VVVSPTGFGRQCWNPGIAAHLKRIRAWFDVIVWWELRLALL